MSNFHPILKSPNYPSNSYYRLFDENSERWNLTGKRIYQALQGYWISNSNADEGYVRYITDDYGDLQEMRW